MTGPQPPSARVFLALWPPDGVRDALLAAAAGWQWPPGASRTRAQRLHLTLHFIGDVPLARLDGVAAGLAVPFTPFALELAEPEIWRGTAVLATSDVPAALRDLHAGLAQALAALQLPVEQRPFRPHVTLARKAQGARPQAATVRWAVADGYRLVRSLPGGQGYAPLAGFG